MAEATENHVVLRTGYSLADRVAKRSLDIIVSISGLVIIAPLLIAVAIAIKVSSPGPVFYRGIRTGRWGREFRIFKFRTMVVDAESLGGPSTGLNDARVTKLGRILRRYKVDEIPNLMNVLVGQMSLVGPRPEVPQYTSLYEGDEKLILEVRPGITDLSSLQFIDLASHIGADDIDENFEQHVLPEKNRLRVKYVKTRSFAGDLRIMLATITRIVRGNRNAS